MFKNATNKKFCDILKQLIKENGLSDNKLAKRTGLNRSTIERYKKDPNSSPVLKHVITLANYFNVSVSYIVGETDVKEADDIVIGDNLGIDHRTIQNLKKINEINLEFDNNYKDLLSDVLTNPNLYNTLIQETDIILNNDLKETANNKIKENEKRIIGKSNSQYDDYVNIIVCQKFLERYNTYITFRNPINLTEAELKEKEAELKKQLKTVQTQLKRYK